MDRFPQLLQPLRVDVDRDAVVVGPLSRGPDVFQQVGQGRFLGELERDRLVELGLDGPGTGVLVAGRSGRFRKPSGPPGAGPRRAWGSPGRPRHRGGRTPRAPGAWL